ncbi:MAG: hypothetical protein KJT03_23785 [Verrucomicrobiae bacterium]|nr:hypothetical protein [Verrucomicrobiae bacterium]
MENESYIKGLLIRSLDQELTPEEAARLRQALEKSSDLRAERQRLQLMRQRIAALRLAENPVFVEDITNRLIELGKETLTRTMAAIFPKVAAACLLLLLLSLAAIYFTTGALSVDAIIGIDELTPEDANIYLSGR